MEVCHHAHEKKLKVEFACLDMSFYSSFHVDFQSPNNML
jgi:hypothetical protein